jgi:hypothetical protein
MEENQITSAAIIFARALSLILQNNEGIIVDVPETIKDSFETSKVVILKTDDKVSIFNFDRDLEEGVSVSLSENNEQ